MYSINTIFIDFGPLDYGEPFRVLRLISIEDGMCTFTYLDNTFACVGHIDFIFDDMEEFIS